MSAKQEAPGEVRIKAQIMRGGEIAMGPGKADLLDAIDRLGSISAAGRELGMSYRRAWLLVDTMNRTWRAPLVLTVVGARTGARLSERGRQVLSAYRELEATLGGVSMSPAALRLVSALAPARAPGDEHDP